jgi:hypothetical protein
MRVVLVGRSGGRVVIRWGVALLLGCALGFFTAAAAEMVYYALAGQFSFIAAAIGFLGPFLTTGVGIQHAMQIPISELSSFDDPA